MTSPEHGEAVTSDRDTLAEVMGKHQYQPSPLRGVERCVCGWSSVGEPGSHADHVATSPEFTAFLDAEKARWWREGYNLNLDLRSPLLYDAICDLEKWGDGLEAAAEQWLDDTDSGKDEYDRLSSLAREARRHAKAIRAALDPETGP